MKRKIVCLLCVCSIFSTLVGCTSQNQEIVVRELAAFEPAVAVKEDADISETTIVGESVIMGEAVASGEVSTVQIKETESVMTTAPTQEVTKEVTKEVTNEVTKTEKDQKETGKNVSTMESIEGEATEEASTEAQKVDTNVISFGRHKGNRYVNRYLNIGCNPPSNWVNASAEDIYARNGVAAGLSDGEYADFFEKTSVVIDMVATKKEVPDTLTVNYNRLTGAALLVDDVQYLDIALNSMAAQFSNMGFENVTAVKSVTTFMGQQHDCIRVEGEREGTKVYEIVIYIKKGNHMATITGCTWGENTVDSLMNCFYKLP